MRCRANADMLLCSDSHHHVGSLFSMLDSHSVLLLIRAAVHAEVIVDL